MKNIKNIITQYKLKSFIYRKNFKQTYFFSKNNYEKYLKLKNILCVGSSQFLEIFN